MDLFPMIFTDEQSGLTFVRKDPASTVIEVGRTETVDGQEVFHLDQTISVYDHETGKITIESTRAAFLDRIAEWLGALILQMLDDNTQ